MFLVDWICPLLFEAVVDVVIVGRYYDLRGAAEGARLGLAAAVVKGSTVQAANIEVSHLFAVTWADFPQKMSLFKLPLDEPSIRQ